MQITFKQFMLLTSLDRYYPLKTLFVTRHCGLLFLTTSRVPDWSYVQAAMWVMIDEQLLLSYKKVTTFKLHTDISRGHVLPNYCPVSYLYNWLVVNCYK